MNSIKPLYTYLDELDFESKTAQHAKYFGLDIMVYRQFVFGFLQKLYERIADESAQPENKPLALDELRQMDGEPVWVVTLDGTDEPRWEIVVSAGEHGIDLICVLNGVETRDYADFDLYNDTWLAYRNKPVKEELI